MEISYFFGNIIMKKNFKYIFAKKKISTRCVRHENICR